MKKVLIMGAAGRDFHNFNVMFRNNPDCEVVCFTAAQIPNITNRKYPGALAGPKYPYGISIFAESDLRGLIKEYDINEVILSYSDLSNQEVMEKASLAMSVGAEFRLLSPHETMLRSKKPVVAVTAVRTGAGKSPLTRYIVEKLKKMKKKVAVVRHPMPYGDLEKMAVQRFATMADIDAAGCTVEEREEYEPLVSIGVVVFAGVDYERILREAEKEADVILWDGGNNDTPFFKPDLQITVCDALRPGHEVSYYPGFLNLLLADIVLINKVDMAKKKDVESIIANVQNYNKRAYILQSRLAITSENAKKFKGKKGLIIEDGPTVTHGGMKYGAGYLLAKQAGIKPMNIKKHLRGDLKLAFDKYAQLDGTVMPALGYSQNEIADMKYVIKEAKPSVIVTGTPIDISHIIKTEIPILRAKYDLEILKDEKIILNKLQDIIR